MPTLPSSIPGVGSVMRTPDKLFRAELSMLQDLIKMSQKMIQNPVMATVEIPKGKCTYIYIYLHWINIQNILN